MTWLLVEDDTDIRNVISVMMTVWGEKPLVFPDGNAAWRWLDSVENGTFQGELPELALMDIRMPGHWGDKIAARIRQTPGVGHIPIVLMTAFTLSETEINAMKQQAGVDSLINKPLPDLDVFRTMLYEVRDKRKAAVSVPEQLAVKETGKVDAGSETANVDEQTTKTSQPEVRSSVNGSSNTDSGKDIDTGGSNSNSGLLSPSV